MATEYSREMDPRQIVADSFIIGGAISIGSSMLFFFDEFLLDGDGNSSMSEIITNVPDFGIKAGLGAFAIGLATNVSGRLWSRHLRRETPASDQV